MKLSSHLLANSCIVTPKQFWKVADLFVNALILSPFNSCAFDSAVDAFSALGIYDDNNDNNNDNDNDDDVNALICSPFNSCAFDSAVDAFLALDIYG
jgi:hypothetical protein